MKYLPFFVLFLIITSWINETKKEIYPYDKFNSDYLFDATRLVDTIDCNIVKWTGQDSYYDNEREIIQSSITQVGDSTYEYVKFYYNGDTLERGDIVFHKESIIVYDTIIQFDEETYDESIEVDTLYYSSTVLPSLKYGVTGNVVSNLNKHYHWYSVEIFHDYGYFEEVYYNRDSTQKHSIKYDYKGFKRKEEIIYTKSLLRDSTSSTWLKRIVLYDKNGRKYVEGEVVEKNETEIIDVEPYVSRFITSTIRHFSKEWTYYKSNGELERIVVFSESITPILYEEPKLKHIVYDSTLFKG